MHGRFIHHQNFYSSVMSSDGARAKRRKGADTSKASSSQKEKEKGAVASRPSNGVVDKKVPYADQVTARCDHDTNDEQAPIVWIKREHVQHPGILDTIYKDLKHHYYATEDWHPDMYLQLAYSGFISVAHGNMLLPEIQKKYCVLDFKNLHIERHVKKRAKKYTLTFDQNLNGVLAGIAESHSKNNWMGKRYQILMRILHMKGQFQFEDSQVRLHSVELCCKKSGELLAGEVGYSFGKVYTSLTGYVKGSKSEDDKEDGDDKDAEEAKDDTSTENKTTTDCKSETKSKSIEDKKAAANEKDKEQDTVKAEDKDAEKTPAKKDAHPSAGKIQLCALAKCLEKAGFDFWNLGHPPRTDCMRYKAEIGGVVVSRGDFLNRWIPTRSKPPVTLGGGVYDADALIKGRPNFLIKPEDSAAAQSSNAYPAK